MEELKKNIGKRIKKMRKTLGFTQVQLAEIINIDNFYLSRIENGLENPSMKMLSRISAGLGEDIHVFFASKEEKHNRKELKEKINKLLEKFKDDELKIIYEMMKLFKIMKE